MRTLPIAAALAALVFVVAPRPVPAAAPAADGAALFARCAACHTATGKGVPGAYPPLGTDFRKLAAKPQGRRYLALVVSKGVMGALTVEGKPYRGVMPAQTALDAAGVAAVLNHVGTRIATSGPAFKPFNAAEIEAARASGVSLTAADVAKLHATVGGG
ncbi:MAG: cytochrome c [Sphingomonadales bacterium]|nr:cytochrome c [Sphingomonadales bacterium]